MTAILLLLPLLVLGAFAIIECNTVDDGEDLSLARAVPDQVDTERDVQDLTDAPDFFDAAEAGYDNTDALEINGLEGTDEIITLEGDDIIRLGPAGGAIGLDVQLAMSGAGDDWLEGGADNDVMFGGAGDDVLFGGRGGDTLSDGDTQDGAAINFATHPNPSGSDNDWFNGGTGDDVLLAAFGQDTLIGGRGNDVLDARDYGGPGQRDTLLGDGGDDVLYGDDGDLMEGGSGNDHFIVDLSAGGIDTEDHDQVEIYDFNEDHDRLTLIVKEFSGGDEVVDVSNRVLFGGVEIIVRTDEGVFGTNEHVVLLRGVNGYEFEQLRDEGGFNVQNL